MAVVICKKILFLLKHSIRASEMPANIIYQLILTLACIYARMRVNNETECLLSESIFERSVQAGGVFVLVALVFGSAS